jgi:hypothetical protein
MLILSFHCNFSVGIDDICDPEYSKDGEKYVISCVHPLFLSKREPTFTATLAHGVCDYSRDDASEVLLDELIVFGQFIFCLINGDVDQFVYSLPFACVLITTEHVVRTKTWKIQSEISVLMLCDSWKVETCCQCQDSNLATSQRQIEHAGSSIEVVSDR